MEAPESGKYTIKQVFTNQSGKINKATFKDGGHEVTAYISPNYVTAEVKEGVEAECVFEVKTWDDGGQSLAVKQWGEPKTQGPKGGFGGGQKWQPKSMDEIIASYPCVSAREANAYAMAENLRKGLDAKDHISWEQVCEMAKKMAQAMAEGHAIIKGKIA